MGWSCVRVRRHLALYVGEDLGEQEKQAVERHVRSCAGCRGHLQSLERSRDVISQIGPIGCELEDIPSVWPELKDRLIRQGSQRHAAGAWLPFGATLAACMAIGVVVWNRPVRVQPTPSLVAPALSAQNDWRSPDWASELTSPAWNGVGPYSSGWPEGTVSRAPHFHLESALPVGITRDDF